MALTSTQRAFATCRDPFPAFVGGFGSGKTAAAIARAMALKSHFRGCDVAYYLPTYPLVEDIAFRRFPDLCERKDWQYSLNKTSAYIEFPGSGRIIFRTMEHPERIVGYEVAHSICDELDTLPTDKAGHVWNKIIARNRQKCSMGNTVAVATTPEGYRFVYEKWQKKPAPGYTIFRARTSDNIANLPPEYIDNLRNTYPEPLLQAYLDGEFVNMTSGSVYLEFDRKLNATTEVVSGTEPVHVGMDFNVANMSAVVYVLRNDEPCAVDELTGIVDTPAMIAALKQKYYGHQISVYPDASGSSRSTHNASISDMSLLHQANFAVRVNSTNPAVRDRVMAMNAMIHTNGRRRLRVNVDRCPMFTEALEKQAYDKNGAPDKKGGFDHVVDAGGYFIAYRYPVADNRMQLIKLGGV